MSTHYDETAEGAGRRRSLLPLLLVPLIAFIGGIVAMGWLLTRWSGAASFIGVTAEAPAPAQPRPAPVAAAPAAKPSPADGEPQRLVIDPEMSRRVARLENHITQIDSQAREAVGNADRAEGLLVAFAARRALDRGVALGYIEGLLRERFAATQPQAVATIIAAGRNPVTLQQLQEALQEVGPQIVGGGPNQSWWSTVRAEFGNLVTIRKKGTPSTVPSERLKRAERRLEAGDVDVALAELMRLPGRERAAGWIAMARRYVAARRALDTIETAALLEPRTGPAGVERPVTAALPGPRDRP